jgi:hypothetical protein
MIGRIIRAASNSLFAPLPSSIFTEKIRLVTASKSWMTLIAFFSAAAERPVLSFTVRTGITTSLQRGAAVMVDEAATRLEY